MNGADQRGRFVGVDHGHQTLRGLTLVGCLDQTPGARLPTLARLLWRILGEQVRRGREGPRVQTLPI